MQSNNNEEPTLAPMDLPTTSMPPGSNSISTPGKGERLRYIDMTRGFVMFFLAFFTFFPPDDWSSNPIDYFFTQHPGPFSNALTFYDLGTPAFLFVMGLSFSIAFQKHVQREGVGRALLRDIVKYGLLMTLGLLIIFVGSGAFTEIDKFNPSPGDLYYGTSLVGTTMTIVIWDVIPAIALAGLASIPFMLMRNPLIRAIIAYSWMFAYGLIFQFDINARLYAMLSVHSGIFGTLFTFVGIVVMGSVIGDYLFHSEHPDKQKYTNLFLIGIINLGIGLVVDQIAGWEATKRQGSFSYGLISIGASTLILFFFAYLDKKRNWYSTYIGGFGQNPFLVYFLVEIPDILLSKTIGHNLSILKIGDWGNVISCALVMLYISLILRYLRVNNKIITTEKATLMFMFFATLIGIVAVNVGFIKVSSNYLVLDNAIIVLAMIGSFIVYRLFVRAEKRRLTKVV